MDSVNQAHKQAWNLWARLARPALLRYPILGVSAALVVSSPFAASARALPHAQEFVSARPTQRQLHMLRSYERYMARVRSQAVRASRAVRFAYRQVGKPYQWGGAGPRTYDCSGLAMAAWRKGGLSLPHRADLQHRIIRRKVGIRSLRAGDLVFFSGDHHVGIYVGHRHFLHAPHTGARVQRGTLTGWRVRVFAGAARPGAPAYHAWPHWVRRLARHPDGPHPRRRAHRPTRIGTPDTGLNTGPDTGLTTGSYEGPYSGSDTDHNTGPYGGPETMDPQPWLEPPTPDVDASARPPSEGEDTIGAPADIGAPQLRGEPAPAADPSARTLRLHSGARGPRPVRPVPPAADHAHDGTSPAAATATPAPAPSGTRPVTRHRWPRTSVQTDSDDYNSTLDGNGDVDHRPDMLGDPYLQRLLGGL